MWAAAHREGPGPEAPAVVVSGVAALYRAGSLGPDRTVLVSTAELVYLVLASALTCLACVAAVRHRAALVLFSPGYRAQLLARPRLLLFAVALGAFVLLAPLTGDPTWDFVDATFMSLGCYALAPWSWGVLYRWRQRTRLELGLALVLSLFTVSWSYDLYLVVRDGVFPPTSRENLVASTILYALGGLFFSLGQHETRGLIFVFMDERWPTWSGDAWSARGAGRALLLASLLAAPIVVFMAWVVLTELGVWPF